MCPFNVTVMVHCWKWRTVVIQKGPFNPHHRSEEKYNRPWSRLCCAAVQPSWLWCRRCCEPQPGSPARQPLHHDNENRCKRRVGCKTEITGYPELDMGAACSCFLVLTHFTSQQYFYSSLVSGPSCESILMSVKQIKSRSCTTRAEISACSALI